MSDLEKLLEDVARDLDKVIVWGSASRSTEVFCEVLKRRLLPLLEAGQAMRASLESLWQSEFETRRDKHPELRDESVQAWDAALEKAKGK